MFGFSESEWTAACALVEYLDFEVIETMTVQPLIRRRNPIQSRAEFTLSAIRDAGLRILEQEGAARLTTNHIAEVAGVSIGALYQYYPDKYAIVADICNELLLVEFGQFDRMADQALGCGRDSLDDAVNHIVRECLARHRKLYRFLKEYYLEIHWRYDFEAYLVKKYPNRHMATATRLSLVLKHHGATSQAQEQTRAAELIVDLVNGTIHATLQRRPDGIFDDCYGDDLVTLVMRYLHAPETLLGLH